MKTNRYFLYIRYEKLGLTVYDVESDDIFHEMGELVFRSADTIKRINYAEWSEEKEDFWNKENQKIYKFRRKY